METRPYMRARYELAKTLWIARRYDEAIDHFAAMIELNPNDNQGIRYDLLPAYLELGRHDDAERLIMQYRDDGSAIWSYAQLLLSFRIEGDSPATRKRVVEAKKTNKFLIDFLLFEKPLPQELPDYYSPGDEREAIQAAVALLPAWRGTPGATSFLRESLGAARAARKKEPGISNVMPQPAGPRLSATDVPQLPDEVWQVDARELPTWVQERQDKYRPWLTVVHSKSRTAVLASGMGRSLPTVEEVRQLLESAIVSPMVYEPALPAILEISRADWLPMLRSFCESLDVQIRVRDDLREIDEMLEQFAEFDAHPEGPQISLSKIPGISSERIAELFSAAAAYYRQQPWKRCLGDTVIRVSAPAFMPQPWFACVMGQSGLELGLALYESWEQFAAILNESLPPEQMSAYSLMFDESLALSDTDLAAQEKHGWEVAGPEAYPCILRIQPGMELVEPTPHELTVLELCLKALPPFIRNPRNSKQQVLMGNQPIDVELSYFEDGRAVPPR